MIAKGQEEIFRGGRYVLYLDCGDGFMGVHRCQDLSNFTL